MYEKQINELEIMMGRYRYLEDLGKKYKAKFAKDTQRKMLKAINSLEG